MATSTLKSPKTLTKPTLTKKQSKALEKITAFSSEPWHKPSLSKAQMKDFQQFSDSCPLWGLPAKKPNLQLMLSLTECLQLLQKLAEEVNNISQVKYGSKKAIPEESSKDPGSLESSRSLILHWAKEMEQNMVKRETKPMDEKTLKRRDVPEEKEKTELEKNDKLQQWAAELCNIKDANGVSDEELKQLLYSRGPKASRLAALLPMLEFVAWSLLSEDTEEAVSKSWLPTKQKAWRTATGHSKYIPNSVWQWIQGASVPVRLDASTSHQWLAVSSDCLQVREAATRSATLSNNIQRFAEWPAVLGDTIITSGRHYWEVEVSPSGSWRLGVMSQYAKRQKKSTMSPGGGYWTLWKGSSLWACTNDPTKLRRAAVPRLIGVYVDVGEGQVSFYDVDRRVHIYTFSDTFKHGLIPLFVCLDGDTVLKIKPTHVSVSADIRNLNGSGFQIKCK